MKKTYLFLTAFILLSISSFAQGTVDLTIKWNATASKYEVYAKPNFTSAAFTWGASQISIVVPAATPDAALTITSSNAGGWTTNNQIFAPGADTAHDFHSVISSGQNAALTSGQETLLFSFTLSDGLCRDGIRLFVNTSDPSSSAAGMKGGDFKNTIDNGLITDVYGTNYNNTGTSCSTCNITAPELVK